MIAQDNTELLKSLVEEYNKIKDNEVFKNILEITRPLQRRVSLDRFRASPYYVDLDSIESFAMEGVYKAAEQGCVDFSCYKRSIDLSIINGLRTCFYNLESEKSRIASRVVNLNGYQGIASIEKSPERICIENEESEIFLNSLTRGLSDLDIELLYLRFGETLSQKEISEKINRSASYVRRHLKSLKQRLADEFKKVNGELNLEAVISGLKELHKPNLQLDTSIKFKSYEYWKSYGIVKGYNNRNPMSLRKSSDKQEITWYKKGDRNKWLNNFEFKRIHERSGIIFNNYKEWMMYGVSKGYTKKNPSSLRNSCDKKERAWYFKGKVKKWLKNLKN